MIDFVYVKYQIDIFDDKNTITDVILLGKNGAIRRLLFEEEA